MTEHLPLPKRAHCGHSSLPSIFSADDLDRLLLQRALRLNDQELVDPETELPAGQKQQSSTLHREYEHQGILVVNKSAGLPSQPTRSNQDNLYERLSLCWGYVGLHHRLIKKPADSCCSPPTAAATKPSGRPLLSTKSLANTSPLCSENLKRLVSGAPQSLVKRRALILSASRPMVRPPHCC